MSAARHMRVRTTLRGVHELTRELHFGAYTVDPSLVSLSICCKDDALDDKPCALDARSLWRLARMATREAVRLERNAATLARRTSRKGEVKP